MRLVLQLFPLLVLAACGHSDPNARETSVEKTEWSILQGIEAQAKSKAATPGELQKVEDYEFLGILGTKNELIWIMLNPKAPPYYKQLPHGNYEISRELLERLISEQRLGYTVEQVLASRVAP